MASSTASFPVSLRSFTTKRNLLDDVDAGDVNGIQDEILAIEQTLGLMPTFDPASQITFSSVAQRLNYLQSGEGMPAFYLGRGTGAQYKSIPGSQHNTSTSLSTPDLNIVPMTDVGSDDYNMFNGTGVTIPSAGWWLIGGQFTIISPPTSPIGSRTISVAMWRGNSLNVFGGATQTTVGDETGSIARGQNEHLNTQVLYPLLAGDHVDVRAQVNSLSLTTPFVYTVTNTAFFGIKLRNIKAPTGTWPAPVRGHIG